MMRKLVLLLAVVGAMVALTAGVALAVTEDGGRGNDIVVGTDAPDSLYGGSGADRVYGYGASDYVSGGSGNDTVYAADGYVDYIECGSGYDRVQRDYFDSVRGCEAAF